METRKEYLSPVVIHPGENVREWMEENEMTAAELARRSGLSEMSIRRIADGWEDITPESAAALERGTSMSANFLLRFQKLYENTLEHLARQKAAKIPRGLRRMRRRTIAPVGV